MTKICNLPRDLVEEILSMVPVTSLKTVRLTCKNWNTLTKDVSFSKKHLSQAKVAAAREREFFVVMMMDLRVYLMRVNLHNNVESRIKRDGQVISLDGLDNQIDVLEIFHCDGLLLCHIKDNTRLLLWNPYRGQTRWIEPVHVSYGEETRTPAYSIGYEKISKSCRNYKILRFFYLDFSASVNFEYKIYNFNSDSWRVLDVSIDWQCVPYNDPGVSLDGNTYWLVLDFTRDEPSGSLLWFDFTRGRFAPHLPLPFQIISRDTVTLSCVRQEQLAALIQRWESRDTLHMDIWITNKIESDTVSWSCKLSVQMYRLPTPFKFPSRNASFFIDIASFFIDEEKKVVVLFAKDKRNSLMNYTRNVAYIVGVDGSLEKVELEEPSYEHCFPHVCSYVPSLVQLY